MTDIWTALAPQLAHLSPTQPREALALADTHRAEVAPPLVALLEALAADPAPAKADGYVLHLYAMLLLAAWRDTRAYRPLVALGHLDEASIDEVFGQLVHDSYGRALASCCDGDIAPLTRLADDDSASLWSRAAALEALTLAALTGRAARGPVVDFLADFGAREALLLKDKPDAGAELELLDLLVVCLADLGAAELLPTIREWFAAGLVDDSYVTLADVEADIRRSPAECLASLREDGRGLIDDVAHEAALWPAFHELPPVRLPPIPLGSLREPVRRDETKVGRNDPCPCGSGRKYKKCHGAH
jgi:hypothetical protein